VVRRDSTPMAVPYQKARYHWTYDLLRLYHVKQAVKKDISL